MRYALLVLPIVFITPASAGPLDGLGGIPDAPGVVQGGSFGLTGNDYWGSRDARVPAAGRARQQAKMRSPQSAPGKRLPRS